MGPLDWESKYWRSAMSISTVHRPTQNTVSPHPQLMDD